MLRLSKVKILAFSLVAALVLAIPANAEITLEGTGIPYGKDHAHFLTAPSGWVLDTDSGTRQGLFCVFYPKGSNWNGEVAAYSNANCYEGRTLQDVLEADVNALRKNSPQLKVTDGGTLLTKDGKKAIVKYFTGDSHNNSEVVAYVPEEKVVINIVMTARNEPVFNISMPAFRELVASYEWISDNPEAPDFMKLARDKRPSGFKLPKPVRTMTKIEFRDGDKPPEPTVTTLYRSGSEFLRLDISGQPISVTNTPDIYVIDNKQKIAQHTKDPGPIYGTVLPVFHKFIASEKSPLRGLEYGLEYDYFQRYGASQNGTTYSLTIDGTKLVLDTKPGTNIPVRLSASKGDKTESIEYISYKKNLPFDANLFALPANLKVVEAQPK